jgi:hypothetical protein
MTMINLRLILYYSPLSLRQANLKSNPHVVNSAFLNLTVFAPDYF